MAPISHNQKKFLTHFEGAEHEYKSHFSIEWAVFLWQSFVLWLSWSIQVRPVHTGTFSCMTSVQHRFLVCMCVKQQRVNVEYWKICKIKRKNNFKHLEVEEMPPFTEKHQILVTVECVVHNLQNSQIWYETECTLFWGKMQF